MWKLVSEEHPPINRIIKTKIYDQNGCRNEEYLKFDGKFWWLPDGSMYVYYSPTHWFCHV